VARIARRGGGRARLAPRRARERDHPDARGDHRPGRAGARAHPPLAECHGGSPAGANPLLHRRHRDVRLTRAAVTRCAPRVGWLDPAGRIRWRTSTGMSTEPSVSSSSSFNVALVGLVRDRGEIQPVWHRPSRPRRPGGASSRSAAEPASLSTLSIRTSTSASTFFRSTHLTEGGSPGHISAGGSWSGIPGRGRSIACGRRMKSSATRRSRPTHAFSSLAARARRPLHHRDIHREYRCP
jgi:hypothetical protein